MSRKNIGLTLIEVLVVITVLSVLSLSVYIVFKSGMDSWSKSEIRLDVFQNARGVLDQISRELPGAFVDGDVTFVGTNGVDDAPDIIEFATNFSGSIYQIKYELDVSGDPPRNVLKRHYEENPDYGASDGYTPSYTEIEFAGKENATGVSNIQFYYLPQGSIADDAWDTAEEEWNSTAEGDTLPEAVKITIKLKESPDARDYTFETIVYLPNSE